VNVDQFITRNQGAWVRLDELTRSARRNVKALSPAELDELIALYQRTSAHLSDARGAYPNTALVRQLTQRVALAHGVIYGKRPRTVRSILRFFTETFPAAVWHDRRFVLASAILFFVPALLVGAYIGTDDRALDADQAAAREAYLEEDFEDYYSSEPAAQFATEVTVNNIRVAIMAFAAGILLCVPCALLLIYNGANVGAAGGVFIYAGEAGRFFGLILPHGLLELSAIVVAGAAGLRLGWTVISPGDRPRGEALAEEGRRSVVIVMGLFLAFVVAGLIEGFVTGSGLPTFARVGIGLLVVTAAALWVVVQGRKAAAQGITGLMGEGEHITWDSFVPEDPTPADQLVTPDALASATTTSDLSP
jgi:uncharacterized membrane protein SpoIIM required for sporulation